MKTENSEMRFKLNKAAAKVFKKGFGYLYQHICGYKLSNLFSSQLKSSDTGVIYVVSSAAFFEI